MKKLMVIGLMMFIVLCLRVVQRSVMMTTNTEVSVTQTVGIGLIKRI